MTDAERQHIPPCERESRATAARPLVKVEVTPLGRMIGGAIFYFDQEMTERLGQTLASMPDFAPPGDELFDRVLEEVGRIITREVVAREMAADIGRRVRAEANTGASDPSEVQSRSRASPSSAPRPEKRKAGRNK